MSDTINTRNDFPSEKKVWSPVLASQVTPDPALAMPMAVYFLAIEELQGSWKGEQWEEAEGGLEEEWEEEFTDSTGKQNVKLIRRTVPRARRYVLKRFTETGFAQNAYSSYEGNRKHQQK